MRFKSPLRYPGGKGRLSGFFADLVKANALNGGIYVEPFAGGAGVGLSLLSAGLVSKIIINDYDPSIFYFWKAVTEQNRAFIQLVQDRPLSLEEWRKQKATNTDPDASTLERGFSAFYLNRTSRSGARYGGVIGGLDQKGNDLIDARFNRSSLSARIYEIGRLANRIEVYGLDAEDLMSKVLTRLPAEHTLVYFDPPYYVKGKDLYMSYYNHLDHRRLSEKVDALPQHWVVSYDDHPVIWDLYRPYRNRRFKLDYSTRTPRKGDEVMIFSDSLSIPDNLKLPNQASG